MDSAQNSDLVLFFGDMYQSEKLSEIKPPLVKKVVKKNLKPESSFRGKKYPHPFLYPWKMGLINGVKNPILNGI